MDEVVLDGGKHILIIVGGPPPTALPEDFLNQTKADIVVIGEGEYTIVNLVRAIENGNPLENVNGIMFKDKNGFIKRTPPADMIMDLDSLPFPAWDLFDTKRYISKPVLNNKPTFLMFTSRGCPYNCKFCSRPFKKVWRGASPIKMIEEMALLVEKFNIQAINFHEDDFLHNKKRVYEFCDLLKKEKMDIEWTCEGRISNINKDIVLKMKSAGCVAILTGTETGSERMLKYINKAQTLSQIYDYINVMKETNMTLKTAFMLGLPTETLEDANQTLALIKKMNRETKSVINIVFYSFRPNTAFYNEWVSNGNNPFSLRDWANTDSWNLTYNVSNMTDLQLKIMYSRMYFHAISNTVGMKRLWKRISSPQQLENHELPLLSKYLRK